MWKQDKADNSTNKTCQYFQHLSANCDKGQTTAKPSTILGLNKVCDSRMHVCGWMPQAIDTVL